MQLAGFVRYFADSCMEIKNIADCINTENDGHGAVRNIIETILKNSKE